MLYKDKEYTSQEIEQLLAEKDQAITAKDQLIGEKDAKLSELEKGKTTEAPVTVQPVVTEKPVEVVPATTLSEPKEVEKKLAEDNKKLADRVIELEEKNRKSDVELRLKAYCEKGLPPVIVDKAKEWLLADKLIAGTFVFNENNAVVSKSSSDCIYAMLDVISGVEFGEATVVDQTGSSTVGASGMTEKQLSEKVSERQKKDGCSFMEAYRKMVAEKAIPEIQVQVRA